MTGKNFLKFKAEIVSGKCPTCEENTLLVGLTKNATLWLDNLDISNKK